MASNFHLFTWRQNIIVSNISPPPLGENFIVSNIYSSPGVRILYHEILTPSLWWEYYIIKYSLLYMGWQYYSIKYSPLLPDDDDDDWMFICWLRIEWHKKNHSYCTSVGQRKGLPFSTNFAESKVSSFSFTIKSNSNHIRMRKNRWHNNIVTLSPLDRGWVFINTGINNTLMGFSLLYNSNSVEFTNNFTPPYSDPNHWS